MLIRRARDEQIRGGRRLSAFEWALWKVRGGALAAVDVRHCLEIVARSQPVSAQRYFGTIMTCVTSLLSSLLRSFSTPRGFEIRPSGS